MFFSVNRQEHGEKCHFMKVVGKLPALPRYRVRPALPYQTCFSYTKLPIIQYKISNLSLYLNVFFISLYLHVCLSLRPSVYLSIRLSIYLSIYTTLKEKPKQGQKNQRHLNKSTAHYLNFIIKLQKDCISYISIPVALIYYQLTYPWKS